MSKAEYFVLSQHDSISLAALSSNNHFLSLTISEKINSQFIFLVGITIILAIMVVLSFLMFVKHTKELKKLNILMSNLATQIQILTEQQHQTGEYINNENRFKSSINVIYEWLKDVQKNYDDKNINDHISIFAFNCAQFINNIKSFNIKTIDESTLNVQLLTFSKNLESDVDAINNLNDMSFVSLKTVFTSIKGSFLNSVDIYFSNFFATWARDYINNYIKIYLHD